MAKSARKFGEIPAEMKGGPITLRNYPWRAEAHCATVGGKRGNVHPTIKLGTADFRLWRQYFETHLGGVPADMQRLFSLDVGHEMTVPEQFPQWFDPSFVPNPGWREPPFVQPVSPARRWPPIPEGEDYFSMCEKAGMRVSGGRAGFKRFTVDELRALYAPQPDESVG